jgi:TonB family protein
MCQSNYQGMVFFLTWEEPFRNMPVTVFLPQDALAMRRTETLEGPREPKGNIPFSIADELALVAMRAQAFTSATGAAIALTEDGAMVCRASSGTTAPDVGVRLSIEGSFTGLAVTSGQAVRCDDSESDARVDAAACRAMRTRSICVVPVRDNGAVAGVLAAFSSVPNAFGEYHMAVLRTMADLIGHALARERTRAAVPTLPAPEPPTPANAPWKSPPPPRTATPPPALKTKPEVLAPHPPATPARDTPPPRAAAPPIEKKRTPTPPPVKTVKADPVGAPSLGNGRNSIFAAAGEAEAEPDRRNTVIFGGGAAAVLILAIVGWLVVGASKASTKAASVDSPPAAAAPAALPAETSTERIAPPVDGKAVEEVRRRDPSPAIQPVAAKPAPHQPAPVMIAGGSSSAGDATSVADVAAPKLVPAGASSALPALPSDTPVVPTLRAVIVPPHLLARVNPVYPLGAKQFGLHGSVNLEVKIDRRGVVTDVRPISGNSVFYQAAASAIRRWKYSPQTLNGQPVDSAVAVTVNFEMPRR